MHSNKSQLLYVIVIYAVGKCVQWEKERKKKTPRSEGNLLMFTPIAPLTSMEGHEWLYLIFLTTSYQEQIILNDKLIVPLVPYDCAT